MVLSIVLEIVRLHFLKFYSPVSNNKLPVFYNKIVLLNVNSSIYSGKHFCFEEMKNKFKTDNSYSFIQHENKRIFSLAKKILF